MCNSTIGFGIIKSYMPLAYPIIKITECPVGKLNEVSHGNLNTGSALVKTILFLISCLLFSYQFAVFLGFWSFPDGLFVWVDRQLEEEGTSTLGKPGKI